MKTDMIDIRGHKIALLREGVQRITDLHFPDILLIIDAVPVSSSLLTNYV
jgi:hypothetical protein